MKTHSQQLAVGLFAICLCVSTLKSAWAQAEQPVTQGTYFTFRMELLKTRLNLTPTQLQQLKPRVEHETGELLEYACNPATSRKVKLGQFRGVLTDSQAVMRPILTQEQSGQLHKLHDAMLQQLVSQKSPDGCTWEYWARETWRRQAAHNSRQVTYESSTTQSRSPSSRSNR